MFCLAAKLCQILFATPQTVTHQAPLSLEFSKQEYWIGWSSPSPGIFPTQGSNPGLLHCRQILYYLIYQAILGLIQFEGLNRTRSDFSLSKRGFCMMAFKLKYWFFLEDTVASNLQTQTETLVLQILDLPA